MFRRLTQLSVAAAIVGLLAGPALAQVPPGIGVGPYNSDLYNQVTPNKALIVNTAQVPATVHSANQNNYNQKGVVCVFNQSAHSASPSTTFSIEGYDAATNSFITYVTSGAITADATPTPIVTYPGITLITTPTGMVAQALHLPRVWRITEVVGGTGYTTGKVGCNLLN